MVAAIMQPTYIPWLGYFSMIDQVDCFVILDSVQLVKRSWQVRNKIKENGKEVLLTIPILKTKSRDELLIKDAIALDDNWKIRHFERIKQSYKKAEYYEEILEWLKVYYEDDSECSLSNFTSKLIIDISRKIGIDTEILKSSQIKNIHGKKDNLLVNICKKIGAEEYLSAEGSAIYIEKDEPGGEFKKNGIGLKYQNYDHPVYKQIGNKFISHIGIYDLLFNYGFDNSLNIIRSGQRANIDFNKYRIMNGW